MKVVESSTVCRLETCLHDNVCHSTGLVENTSYGTLYFWTNIHGPHRTPANFADSLTFLSAASSGQNVGCSTVWQGKSNPYKWIMNEWINQLMNTYLWGSGLLFIYIPVSNSLYGHCGFNYPTDNTYSGDSACKYEHLHWYFKVSNILYEII